MFGSCATCQFAKRYADAKTSKNGALVYCGSARKAVHVNAVCEDFTFDNVKVYASLPEKQQLCPLRCARCGFTEYARMLAGTRSQVCDEYARPALAVQDELFA